MPNITTNHTINYTNQRLILIYVVRIVVRISTSQNEGSWGIITVLLSYDALESISLLLPVARPPSYQPGEHSLSSFHIPLKSNKYDVLQGATILLLSFFSFDGGRGGVKGRGQLLLSNPARTLWTHKHDCSANKHKEKHLHYLTFKEQQKSLITMGTVTEYVFLVAYFFKLQKERQAFTLKLSQPTTKRACLRRSLKGKKWDLSSVSLQMGL